MNTRTSHAQVVNELGRAIIAGDYPVGTTLPGDVELAARFKVSRTVLRIPPPAARIRCRT